MKTEQEDLARQPLKGRRIFDVFLVPGWPNCPEWPQVSKKGVFFYEKVTFWAPFGAPFLLKVVVLGVFLSG